MMWSRILPNVSERFSDVTHIMVLYSFPVLVLVFQISNSNMTSIKRHTPQYSTTLYLAQVWYTTNLAVPCDSRCEITVTTECKQTKHRHIAYF